MNVIFSPLRSWMTKTTPPRDRSLQTSKEFINMPLHELFNMPKHASRDDLAELTIFLFKTHYPTDYTLWELSIAARTPLPCDVMFEVIH